MMTRQQVSLISLIVLYACLIVSFYFAFYYEFPGNVAATQKYLLPKPRMAYSEAGDRTQTNANIDYTLTLTIRMSTVPRLIKRLYCDLLRSAVLFWSSKLGHISVILDKESEADHRFAATLSRHERELGVKFDFMYEPLPKDPAILEMKRGGGYGRQLWSSFFMDIYINSSIIAWIDTDAMFTTPVTPENIFNGHRLRVVTFTDWKRMHRNGWYKATKLALGKDMVADFMSYFPTYIWRDTITNCRNHMLKHMKVTRLDDAFPKLVNLVSPINVILNYAFYFENDRYDWHLDVNKNLSAYNSKELPRGVNIKPNETIPEVRVTVHETYYRKSKEPNPLLQGYCVAKRSVGPLPANCQAFENVTNFQLFEFGWFPNIIQSHISTWCGSDEGRRDCVRRLEAHYKNVKTYYNLGWFDLNLRRVRTVEKVAAQENTTCPKIFEFD